MTIPAIRLFVVLSGLTLLLVPCSSSPAFAHHRRRAGPAMFAYTSPANVLRGQLALERLGRLERGRYAPGRYDQATRRALRAFQRAHMILATGWLDEDTFAMLPIDERPDGDDDGIPDADDRCRSTKRGARVGYDGCPPGGKRSAAPPPAGAGGPKK